MKLESECTNFSGCQKEKSPGMMPGLFRFLRECLAASLEWKPDFPTPSRRKSSKKTLARHVLLAQHVSAWRVRGMITGPWHTATLLRTGRGPGRTDPVLKVAGIVPWDRIGTGPSDDRPDGLEQSRRAADTHASGGG